MCIKHLGFNRLLSLPAFSSHVAHLAVDKAHCISAWGNEFRCAWGELERIRALLPSSTPTLATTATATPDSLATIRTVLNFTSSSSFHLNLGNDRPNIVPFIVEVDNKDDGLNFIYRLVQDRLSHQVIPKTVIFVNKRETAQDVCDKLQRKIAPERCHKIDYIHAMRHPNGKLLAMKRFHDSTTRILCSTDCAGLVNEHRAHSVVFYMLIVISGLGHAGC